MKITRIIHLTTALGCGLALSAVSKANPTVAGVIQFQGSAQTNSPTTAAYATEITGFLGMQVSIGNGSYAGLGIDLSNPVAVTYSPIVSFTNISLDAQPLWTFTYGGNTYSFVATSISVLVDNTTTGELEIGGSGTASITGDVSNPGGHWSIDMTGEGVSEIFGDSASTNVPDSGMTALLIGLGLAGVGLGAIAMRRKLAATS
jgi:hypothetical protein